MRVTVGLSATSRLRIGDGHRCRDTTCGHRRLKCPAHEGVISPGADQCIGVGDDSHVLQGIVHEAVCHSAFMVEQQSSGTTM